MDRVFGVLPGVHVVVDDILVTGSTIEERDKEVDDRERKWCIVQPKENTEMFNRGKILRPVDNKGWFEVRSFEFGSG